MAITSLPFVAFTLITLAVYYRLPARFQNRWLLLISYLFCISWAWQFAAIMSGLTIFNFALVRRLPDRKLLWLGIGINVAAFLVLREADFFIAPLLALLGTQTAGVLAFLVPIGLSYYTLENIAYLLDVHAQRLTPETSVVNFALYIAYFPRLLAGPIERPGDFLVKLADQRRVDGDTLTRSFTLMIVGAFRKLVIADTLAIYLPWDLFEVPSNFGAAELFAWLVVYSFYLYNDFAGYTSMVRGISGLFGIELSRNFRQPYFARNFSEFWNRWHITLSAWLRDYIYFPVLRALLRRNPGRSAPANLIIPPLLTMLVSGLWHGLNAHMLLWGALHGIFQILERIPTLWGPVVPPQRQPRWRQLVGCVVTFVLVTLAWVPFRAELPVAISFWETLLHWGNWHIIYRRIFLAFPLIAISLALDWSQHQEEFVFFRWPRLSQASVIAISVFLIIFTIEGAETVPFVYQGF